MRIRTATVLLGLLFALPVAAQAQVPGIGVRIVPKIGAYLPLSDLVEAQDAEAAMGLEPGLAVGLAAELELPLSPIGFRVGMDYATGSKVKFDGEGPALAEEPEAKTLMVAADVVFRPLPSIAVVQPYLLAGAGYRNYSFDMADESDSEGDLALHVGIGTDVGIGPIGFVLEVSDYISRFEPEGGESKLQNDVFASVGFRIGIL